MQVTGQIPLFPANTLHRDGIFKLLRSRGIDYASFCGQEGRYDNPFPTRFLAPLECSTIPAQYPSFKKRKQE